MRPWDISADDEILLLVRALLDPCARTLARLIKRTRTFCDITLQPQLLDRIDDLLPGRLEQRREADRFSRCTEQITEKLATPLDGSDPTWGPLRP